MTCCPDTFGGARGATSIIIKPFRRSCHAAAFLCYVIPSFVSAPPSGVIRMRSSSITEKWLAQSVREASAASATWAMRAAELGAIRSRITPQVAGKP